MHDIEVHAQGRIEVRNKHVIVHRAVRDRVNHIRTRDCICKWGTGFGNNTELVPVFDWSNIRVFDVQQ